MQRKAYAPGRSRPAVLTAAALALGLGIGLSGCSSGAKADIDTVDSKAGPASPTAPPVVTARSSSPVVPSRRRP